MLKSVLFQLSACLVLADEPWVCHTIDNSSKGADGVRLADVNGDGFLDIATGWEEGGVVRAYLHPGRGKEKLLWPQVTVGKVKSAEDAVFVDLDGDGAMDVVSSCEGGTKSMFVHWAPKAGEDFLEAGKWETMVIPATAGKQSWMYALPMQIDGKSGLDLVVSSKGKNGSVGWLEISKDARAVSDWKFHKLQEAGWIMSLIAVDMDRDGDDDVLISDRRGAKRGVYWLEYPGTEAVAEGKAWKRHDIGGHDREMKFISYGDLDQDGLNDVVALDKGSVVWFRAQQSGWSEHVIPLPEGVGGGKSTAVLDVNLDGKTDLVFSCEGAAGPLSGMRWLSWQNSPFDKKWQSHEVAGEPGLKYDRVVPCDVDGDGDLDLLCCEERDQLGVFWYENPFRGN
ncbi:VCBS repeat-containing protein [Akkermansiaceae bacterium]|nr:VCBS repeat-containing protein [Akkermansiaceae bacterium]MDB4537402.1 VCBS repeat-containing protein [Akkermansiaceae bacterium]MDB4544593.1 VCBS repeat-containing protein [Akkermansiaceae bacterium]